ncbi:TolC family protein [Echinicola jeungdonensis]|uniref:TolC family protein n=1 Tax=Echinicola jeungdonensis TaxID=709343 RepID=A0ABV5J9Y0_9BACT|nr:TolC family protein [Echinicola jeungdonensis]MDN3670193.1 TolC family protein [Echinicola jeungdonensis]
MKIFIYISLLCMFCLSPLSAQTLEDYFSIAAQNNPGLNAKYREFEASLEKVNQVNTLPDPTFSFGYFISSVETRVGPQQAKFSLTQMFPWFGTLEAKGHVAALMAEAKYQAFLDARNQLFYKVASSYYPLYELERWKKLEMENIQLLESYKTIATKKFENDRGSMVDVVRVDLMLKEAETNLEILTQKEAPLKAQFNQFLNRDEKKEVQVNESLEVELIPEKYRRDSLLSINPGLEELEIKIKASEAQEKVAAKEGLPKLGIGLDYVLVGESQGTGMTVPEESGKNVFMPMVSVSLPIFWKKYKAAKREAHLMQEGFALQKEEYSNSLKSKYEMASFELEKQLSLVRLYDQQIQETQQALNLIFSAYSNSGKEFEEVLRMQQQLLKYEKMKASAKSQYQITLAQLNYLTAKSY